MEKLLKRCMPTYQTVEKIGEGLYGSVYLVKDNLKTRAAKVVPIMAERSLEFSSQTELISKLSRDFHAVLEYYEAIKGEGVIDIHDFHFLEHDTIKHQFQADLVILMEYCPFNLQNYVLDHFPLPLADIRRFSVTLARTLSRITATGADRFLFTDLKPSNLLVTRRNELVIGDLGGFKRLHSLSMTAAGTQLSPAWSAPELILEGKSPDLPSMIFAFGLIAYFLCEGRLPHDDKDFLERIGLMKKHGGVALHNRKLPQHIRNGISQSLNFDPMQRPPSFEHIIRIFDEDPPFLEVTHAAPGPAASQPSRQPIKKAFPTRSRRWEEPVLGMPFVWVPDGCFIMGGTDTDPTTRDNETPTHEVDVEGFWMAKYPVTQAEWYKIMKTNPSHFKKGGRHPVEQISWYEAKDFIDRLNALGPGNYTLGFPFEYQWEYAARQPEDVYRFSGSDDPDLVAWHKGNSMYTTHPVGEKQPNALGIYDLCGNVSEWCEDPYQSNADTHLPMAGEHAAIAIPAAQRSRVGRGGAWNLPPQRCRVIDRRRFAPDLRYANLGLRLICHRDTSD
ncbi:MAG: hypothetical protein CSA22_02850 [Deltaproteobacteria bacterium]|nr:MAG: hypothetical protein CSA22_02850 [Deltaproteobacteria bacterium]